MLIIDRSVAIDSGEDFIGLNALNVFLSLYSRRVVFGDEVPPIVNVVGRNAGKGSVLTFDITDSIHNSIF